MTNKRILWILALISMVCYAHAKEVQAPSNSGDAPQGCGCYFRCLGSETPNGYENAQQGYGMCYGMCCGGCYGECYGRCYGGWQREALDWGMIGGFGLGGYFASKAGPFFEQPLIGGPGDKPYIEEQVTDSWVYASMLATTGAAALLPNQDGWLNGRSYRHLKGALGAITSGYIVKELAKDIVGRPRPDYYDRLARGIEVDEARESWPSGHATHFATAATYLSLFTWDEWRSQDAWAVASKIGITTLLAGAWAYVSWTRIADNRHYPGDVVAGSILGAGTALFFYSYEQWWGKPKEPGTSDQSFMIQATPLSLGVRLSF